jgi:hypothetical protein
MARLQHLTALSLQPSNGLPWLPVGAAYAALTASSSLVCLEVCHTRCPEGIWQHVFPAGRVLQHLTSFSLLDARDAEGAPLPGPAWGAADLASLVSCCSNLRSIAGMPLQPGRHVSELHKLSALTHLGVQYGQGALGVSVSGLAAVTQLQKLDLTLGCQACPATALLSLTSMSALTEFRYSCTLTDGYDDEAGSEFVSHLHCSSVSSCRRLLVVMHMHAHATESLGQCCIMRMIVLNVAFSPHNMQS